MTAGRSEEVKGPTGDKESEIIFFYQGVEFSSNSNSELRMGSCIFRLTSVITAPSLAWCRCSLATSVSTRMEITLSVQKVHKTLNSVKEHKQFVQPEPNSSQDKFTVVPFLKLLFFISHTSRLKFGCKPENINFLQGYFKWILRWQQLTPRLSLLMRVQDLVTTTAYLEEDRADKCGQALYSVGMNVC